MGTFGKIARTDKGFLPLLLSLLFLTTCTTFNFSAQPDTQQFLSARSLATFANSKHHVFKAVGENSARTISSSLQDADADDLESNLLYPFSDQNLSVLPSEEHNFVQQSEHFSVYKVPLYELYCNWKFHLS